MNTQMCRWCLAAWGDIGSPTCAQENHNDATAYLARKLAEVCEHTIINDLVIGWFIEDAAAAISYLGHQEEWRIEHRGHVRSFDGPVPLISVNGTTFVCNEGPMSVYEAEDGDDGED